MDHCTLLQVITVWQKSGQGWLEGEDGLQTVQYKDTPDRSKDSQALSRMGW